MPNGPAVRSFEYESPEEMERSGECERGTGGCYWALVVDSAADVGVGVL